MAEKGSKKCKRFEQLAAEIQREISPEAKVSTNQQIAGKRSGQSRPGAPGSAFLPGCRAGGEFEGGVTAPAIRPAEEVSGQLLAQRLSA